MKRIITGCALLLVAALVSAAPSQPRTSSEPDRAEIAYERGTELLFELRFAEAESYLREAIAERNRFPEAHLNLAYVLRKQGSDRFDEAMLHYDTALQQRRRFPEALMYRGVLHVQMGNAEAAAADLERLESLFGNKARQLSEELAYVIRTGSERAPEQFFGVSGI